MMLIDMSADLVRCVEAFTCFMPELRRKVNEAANTLNIKEAIRTSMRVNPLLNSYPPPGGNDYFFDFRRALYQQRSAAAHIGISGLDKAEVAFSAEFDRAADIACSYQASSLDYPVAVAACLEFYTAKLHGGIRKLLGKLNVGNDLINGIYIFKGAFHASKTHHRGRDQDAGDA